MALAQTPPLLFLRPAPAFTNHFMITYSVPENKERGIGITSV
jgi:hypothetical protein